VEDGITIFRAEVRGEHQQKALVGDKFCIIFTLFMGR
jgi:hypothetical protein